MFRSCLGAILAILVALAGDARAEGPDDPAERVKRGAVAYRVCSSCHSLRPGVHLSGPSLAGRWGRKAASVGDYGRYTEALTKADLVWDTDGLNAWLAGAQVLVPGTTMTLRGIADEGARADLIAFLRVAMAERGAVKVVTSGLLTERTAAGQVPPDLSELGADYRIRAIRHCRDAYYITTAGG
ncbi:MAG: c-type cytochrome, partial [Methyloligellaceae bacterium]